MSRLLTLFSGGQVITNEPETALLVAAGTFSIPTQIALNTFFSATRSFYTDNAIVWLCCGNSLTEAMLAIRYTAGVASLLTMTNVNFVGPDYSESTGLQGDAISKQVNTTVAGDSLQPTAQQITMISYKDTSFPGVAKAWALVGGDGTGTNETNTALGGTIGFYRGNLMNSTNIFTDVPIADRFFGMSRNNTAIEWVGDSVTGSTTQSVSAAMSSTAIRFMQEGATTTAEFGGQKQMAGIITNVGLNATDMAAIRTALVTFNNALGR